MTLSLDDIMSGRGASASSDNTTETNTTTATVTPPEAAPGGQTAESGQQRDGQGRFAGKEQAPAPGPAENATQQPGHVPIQALDAERGKRKETEERYERKLKELEDKITSLSQPQQQRQPLPPQPRPTLYDDPDGYMQDQLSPVQTAILDMKEFVSENMAVQAHGQEKVNVAKAAIEQAATTPEGQRTIAEMIHSQHPFEVLMNWHKRQLAFAEVGDDPEAWFQKRLAAMQAGQQQQPQAQPPQTQQPAAQAAPLPTDFSGAPSGGPRGGPEYGGPRSLTEIMKR